MGDGQDAAWFDAAGQSGHRAVESVKTDQVVAAGGGGIAPQLAMAEHRQGEHRVIGGFGLGLGRVGDGKLDPWGAVQAAAGGGDIARVDVDAFDPGVGKPAVQGCHFRPLGAAERQQARRRLSGQRHGGRLKNLGIAVFAAGAEGLEQVVRAAQPQQSHIAAIAAPDQVPAGLRQAIAGKSAQEGLEPWRGGLGRGGGTGHGARGGG